MPRTHRDLQVWHKGIALVTSVYNMTDDFPKQEAFGLTSQMRRAAASVPANIAEGASRGSRAEFLRFLFIARGSLSELETFAVVAEKVGVMGTEDQRALQENIEEMGAMMNSMIASLRSKRA